MTHQQLPAAELSRHSHYHLTSNPPLNNGAPQIQRLIILGKQALRPTAFLIQLAEQLPFYGKISTESSVINIARYQGDTVLLLIDCDLIAIDNLRDLLAQLYTCLPTCTVALLNVTEGSEQEALVTWPLINGLFYRQSEQTQLLKGLTALLNHQYWLPQRVLRRLLKNLRKPPAEIHLTTSLTKRETEILKQLCDGVTNLEIAARLHVSNHTIKSHMYNIFKKIQVKNRLQACKWAQTHLF